MNRGRARCLCVALVLIELLLGELLLLLGLLYIHATLGHLGSNGLDQAQL